MTTTTPRLRRSPLVPRLVAFALALGALPLVASTCGGGSGPQTFARSSLIIPMDLCYQYQTDGSSGSYTPYDCPQATDPGNVIRAYGLVYQLVRNNIAVYWIIDPNKTALTGTDLTISYTGGVPVLYYDWANASGGTRATPFTFGNGSISYRGGPFVVDGSDFARASQVLQNFKSLYGGVKVHVSNVAFTANVAKTMAGGWNAGGAVPPKLALLDIGSSGAGSKNSEFVIQGYLAKAGLDFAGAGGCVTPVNSADGRLRPECGTTTPTHGQIYDRLYMEDFQPDGTGAVTTTNLFKEGYQILWVPHWAAPTSCSDCPAGASCSCSVKYSTAQIDQALRTIGAFASAGKDVFAECAGLGSFEGVNNSTTYRTGASDASTHFQTTAPAATAGLSSIGTSTPSGAYFWPGNFSSPFLQIGDFPFKPLSGAISEYTSSTYRTGADPTVRLISESSSAGATDLFTILNRSASPQHGTIVYLGGHSYSGNDGTFQIAGTRLVLNTLFNLGAGCVESGVSCNTGLLGVCARGVLRCDGSGRQVCTQLVGASSELCNGLDDDCDGLVDEELDTACYDGPASTLDGNGVPRGICQKGVRSCQRSSNGTYAMSDCQGQVTPSGEVCNGLDDDCNGVVDDAPATAGSPPNPASSLKQACYTGPQSSLDPGTGNPRGICKSGQQACANGVWSACEVCEDVNRPWSNPSAFASCEILPHSEDCITESGGGQYDMNCNGVVADDCGCNVGTPQFCYRGPTGTQDVGACKHGTQTCVAGSPNFWSACAGDVLPAPLDCTKPPAAPPADANCNGIADYQEPGCNLCPPAGDPSLVCYVNADRSAPKGTCQDGVRACANGVLGDCSGVILPAPEVCDGKDNDCDGTVDDGATCPAGLSCVNGACVPTTCGVELPCPDGYDCTADRCVLAGCGTGGPCAIGSVCEFGTCVDPCDGVDCGVGATCASGACAGGSCYFTGCPSGQLCQSGACAPDPCLTVVCPSGTFCRAGDCVQACTFVTCGAGHTCGPDGFCVADPCAAKTCAPGQRCVSGACTADPCDGLGCGQGQVCENGVCVDDPCNGVRCPAGQCAAGQCYSLEALSGPPPVPPPPPAEKSGGCGCGSGSGSALSGLLLLLALPLARRRRRRDLPLAAVAVAAVLAGSACDKNEPAPFDPAQCQETCGEQRCVELAKDPVHCGSCTHVCEAGEICVDGSCGPGAAVAPFIGSVAPPTAPKGSVAPVTIALVGERFAPGATLRTVAPAGTATYPATVTDAAHLTATIDLSGTPATELELRVVNPDRVISNGFPFDVVTPTPQLTAVAPSTVTSGQRPALSLTGTGFMDSSRCHVKGPSISDLALPTTPGSPLVCALDTADLPIGAYELWVVNDGVLASNHLPLAITASGAPQLVALSPSAAATGDTIALTVTGTSFAPSSVVTFGGTAQTTTYLDPTRLLVPALVTPATAATYQVGVVGAPTTLPFVVSATAPRADTMTPTPGSPFQGDSVTLAFTGANLAGANGARIQPPAGASFTVGISGTPTSTSASVAVNLATACAPAATPCPAGLYTAALTFSGGGTSSSFQLRVLSSTAVLQAVAPAGGAQGATLTVAFTASNLRGTQAGALVLFQGNGVSRSLAPATWSPPTAATASLNLAGLDTGVYALQLQNAGAQPSNAVSFTVTPGMPHVTSVSPTSVTRSDTVTPVTLSGTNFAKPDANGNAASAVMVLAGAPWAASRAYAVNDLASTADASYRCVTAGTSSSTPPSGTGSFIADGTVRWAWAGGWTAIAGSPVTVASATQIQVQLDSRTAIPATYRVSVWNPPGPQKSPEVVTFTVN